MELHLHLKIDEKQFETLLGWVTREEIKSQILSDKYLDDSYQMSARLANSLRSAGITKESHIRNIIRNSDNWEFALVCYENLGGKSIIEFKKVYKKIIDEEARSKELKSLAADSSTNKQSAPCCPSCGSTDFAASCNACGTEFGDADE